MYYDTSQNHLVCAAVFGLTKKFRINYESAQFCCAMLLSVGSFGEATETESKIVAHAELARLLCWCFITVMAQHIFIVSSFSKDPEMHKGFSLCK